MHLVDFDVQRFVSDYWQKKPLLIRNPWAAWSNPLEPGDLAGLACEEEIESRLITQARDSWELEHGPIPAERFEQLGNNGWTLLVQAVDQHVPAVAALLDAFRFIPNWRIDDVMVSYAADEGGVGPHFDQYDVFLLQGLGKRRWQVGGPCDRSTALLPHDDLRLLAHFEAIEEWIIEPGDILYLPPGVAHNGVAVGDDCMTYSIGFRAPSRGELIGHWSEHLSGTLLDDDRYDDPQLQVQQNPGEISSEALARLHSMVTEAMRDSEGFARWFGQYSTTPKYPDIDWQPDLPIRIDALRQRLAAGSPLYRNPASRFAFVREKPDALLLFVDGECFTCGKETAALAEHICEHSRIDIASDLASSDAAMELIAALFNQGSLVFEEED